MKTGSASIHGKMQLQAAPDGKIHDFVKLIISRNLRNSVFVDVTANEKWLRYMAHCWRKVYRWLPAIRSPVLLLIRIL
jgi:hypothetical protein